MEDMQAIKQHIENMNVLVKIWIEDEPVVWAVGHMVKADKMPSIWDRSYQQK